MNTVSVILWNYYDKSGFGAVKAYANVSDAEADLKLLQAFGGDGREFELIVIPFTQEKTQ